MAFRFLATSQLLLGRPPPVTTGRLPASEFHRRLFGDEFKTMTVASLPSAALAEKESNPSILLTASFILIITQLIDISRYNKAISKLRRDNYSLVSAPLELIETRQISMFRL